MRLLLLCEYPTLNGGERSMLATLGGVAAAGFQVAALAPSAGPLSDEFRARDIEVVPFEAVGPSGSREPQMELRERLASLLVEHRPDLLHANSLAMGRLSGPVAADLRVPSLSHLRDIVRLSRQGVADINRHSRLLAVSEATRTFHVAQGMTADRVKLLYNGIDLKQFQPRSATGYLHRELGLPLDARLVGTIGQIGLRKGQDVLVRAVTTLADSLPGTHYVLVGERSSGKAESRQFEADLRAAAAAMRGRFHFLGVRTDVDRLLPELALLVHPARQEPLGRVLLEAAACGVAVVATDVGGTREIFPAEHLAARLVPADDGEALADAIRGLLTDQRLRTATAAAARRRIETAFSAEHATARLIEHYREVLGR